MLFSCLFLFLCLQGAFGQTCPSTSFTIQPNLCINESLQLDNTSSNGMTYDWDFCVGDLTGVPTASSVGTLGFPYELEVVDSIREYYGFVASRDPVQIFRLDFGNSLANTPQQTVLNIGVAQMLGVEIFSHLGQWYGYIIEVGGTLYRLEFGTDLKSIPTFTIVGKFGGLTSGINLEYEKIDNSHLLFVLGFGNTQLVRLDFGNNPTSVPLVATVNVTGLSNGSGLSVIKECDTWYGFVASNGNNRVYKINFGSDLKNDSPVITDLGLTLTGIRGITAIEEYEAHYLFGQTGNGEVYRVGFGSSYNNAGVFADLGKFSTLNKGLGFSMYPQGSNYYAFASENVIGGKVYRLAFPNVCNTSTSSSTSFEPKNISYSQPGTYQIGLKATDANGNSRSTRQTVTVGTDVAPDIDFEVDESRCAASSNQFTSTNTSDGIISYYWDFGDGGTSAQPAPAYQYATAGTYEVVLAVSNGSCENIYADTITIYPEPTAASFTLPSGSPCSLSPITFSNTTDETGFGEGLQYLWDFNGEGSSTDRDPIFTFTTSGPKDIDLIAYVPGCTTAIETQQITILEEESPSFTYTHNCMGEDLAFTSTTPTDNVVSYNWDFGDGDTSTQINPTYSFTTAKKHPVTLTVETAFGCTTSVTDTVMVSFDPLADFTVGSVPEENVPIALLGLDLTSDEDEVTAWSWNFDGTEFSTNQNATRIFTTSGTYQVTLTVQTTQGCTFLVNKDVVVNVSVCPYSDFTIQPNLCINESLQLDNTSSNGMTYDWDFCVGDLTGVPIASSVGTLGFPYELEVVDSIREYYGFVASRDPVQIFRLDFGNSLANTPQQTVLNIGVAQMLGVEIFSHLGQWYGYIIEVGGTLYRLEFGTDLKSIPTFTIVGKFGGLTSGINLEYEKIDNSHLLFVLGFGNTQLVRLDFGNNPTSVPLVATVNVTGLSNGSGLSVIKECDTWYGFVASNGNNRVYKINFGSDLKNDSPVITDLGLTLTGIRGITAIEEYEAHYLFGQTGNGEVYRVGFGSSYNNAGVFADLGKFSTLNKGLGFSMYQQGSNYYAFASENVIGGKVYRLAFPNVCNASLSTSTSFEPKNVSYTQPGTYQIGLKATDANGNSRSTRQTVMVGTDVAPDIDFNYRSINCQDINFAFEVHQDVFSTYEWNFGDGQTAAGAEVTHQYASSGIYEVSVTGTSSNGCTNNDKKTINIFSSPPIADFEIQATQLCTNSEISLLNETDVSNYDLGSITYEWSIGNDWASNEKSPMINIDSAGTYEVVLVVNIPGCISDPVSQSFTLLAGVFADFSFETGCEDSPVTFTNLTNDPTATYLWDFGDGFSSTSTEMDHLYTSGGTYTVSLTATASNGCVNTVAKEIVVDTSPDVDFEYSLLCTNTPSTFTDLSVADNADIIAWNWFVDDELVSEEQNPAIIFETPGVKNLRMVVFSSSGCEALLSENVFVIDAPALVVTSELGCLGFASVFTDKTGVSQSRLWMVDGVTQSTTGEVLTYVFNTPGQHTVTLIGLQNSGCSSTREEIITIPANPTLTIAVDGSCANQDIYLTDTTALIAGNEIASRTWRLNGSTFGNGAIALLPTSSGGSYEVELIVQTAFGCELTQTKTITLLDAPSASFSLSVDYGVPPFTITTTNLSSGASSYNWYINDLQVATSGSPNFTISSQGTKTVKLVAKNELGCTDSLEIAVISAIAQADLVIEKMEMIPNGSIDNVLLEIRNNGNLPVEQLDFTIKLENQFKLVERVNQRIDIGKRAVVTLSTGIPIQNSALAYLCVAVANSESPDDIHLADNERCMSIHSETTILEPPYPNPTAGNTTIRMVLKNAGQVKLTVLDMLGQVHTIQVFDDLSAGLHVVLLDLTALDAGTYLVYIQHPSGEDKYKITKR